MAERNKRTLFALIKIIFTILVFALIIKLFVSHQAGNKIAFEIGKHRDDEIVMTDFFDINSYEVSLQSQQSDIKNLTKYDLYKMGLNTDKASDSDMDGLSDKDEIEKYMTDPTKVSSSGDLYSDGYKVDHNMDLKKFYDYNNDLKFSDNNCKEIILNPTDARDFNACVDDYTGSGLYSLDGKNVIRTYSIFNYSGYVTINLSKIDQTLSSNDVNIYLLSFYDDEAKVVKFSRNSSKITLSEKLEYTTPYIIFVVKEKATLAKTFTSSVVGNDISFGTYDPDTNSERAYGVVYGLFTRMKIKYVETDNENLNNALKEKLSSVANNILSERHSSISEEDIKATTEEDVNRTIELYSVLPEIKYPFPLVCNYDFNKDPNSYGLVCTYYIYDDNGELEYAANETNENIILNYDMSADILPFGNFRTEVGTNGVCAGISHLTSYVHNNNSLDMPSGKFKYKDQEYKWNITKDKENETLLNRGLSDYKDASFVIEHSDSNNFLTKNLSDGEKSFVDMISYFWAMGNNSFSVNDYAKGINGKDTDKDISTMGFYDGNVIRNTISELDKGNFVDAYFLLDNSSGHVVNIIGYEKCSTSLLGKSTCGYVFYIYDCNYPSVIGTLTCEIKGHTNGQETLLYRLDIPGASYSATSGASYETNSGKMSLFVVLNDKYEVLN